MNDERKGRPSASGIERLALCPGSWQAERAMPEPPESPDAASGTRLHAVLAGESHDVDDNEAWVIERCKELENMILEQEDFLHDEIVRERRLWYAELYSGKPDVVYIDRDNRRAICIDYKTGRGRVAPADSNWQMHALTVLVMAECNVAEVLTAVIQPLAGDDAITMCRYTGGHLKRAEMLVLDVIRTAGRPDARRVPGADQCRYCRAKSVCPEGRGESLAIVPTDLTTLEALPAMSGQALAETLDKMEFAKRFFAEFEREAKERLERDPESVPGYELKPGSERREITDPQAAFAGVADVVTPEEFQQCCTVKVAALQKLLGQKAAVKNGAARAMLDERLGDAIEHKATAPKLARCSNG